MNKISANENVPICKSYLPASPYIEKEPAYFLTVKTRWPQLKQKLLLFESSIAIKLILRDKIKETRQRKKERKKKNFLDGKLKMASLLILYTFKDGNLFYYEVRGSQAISQSKTKQLVSFSKTHVFKLTLKHLPKAH